MAKLIISESHANKILSTGIINEITDLEVDKKISKAIKSDKDLEKKIKKIVANAVNILFKTLWQRSNFYENEIQK